MVSDKVMIVITGVVCLTIIELYALYCGVNSTLFGAVIATIGGIMGGALGFRLAKRNE